MGNPGLERIERIKAAFPIGRLFWAVKYKHEPNGTFGHQGWGISSWSGYVPWVPHKVFLVKGYSQVPGGLWIKCWSFADEKEVELWQDLFDKFELETLGDI